MDSGYKPSRRDVLNDMFSAERIGKLYDDTIEFGKGFGNGLWFSLQFPYNIPTQKRKFVNGESILQRDMLKEPKLIPNKTSGTK